MWGVRQNEAASGEFIPTCLPMWLHIYCLSSQCSYDGTGMLLERGDPAGQVTRNKSFQIWWGRLLGPWEDSVSWGVTWCVETWLSHTAVVVERWEGAPYLFH